MDILKAALEIAFSPESLVFMAVSVPVSFMIGYISQRERHKYQLETAKQKRNVVRPKSHKKRR